MSLSNTGQCCAAPLSHFFPLPLSSPLISSLSFPSHSITFSVGDFKEAKASLNAAVNFNPASPARKWMTSCAAAPLFSSLLPPLLFSEEVVNEWWAVIWVGAVLCCMQS